MSLCLIIEQSAFGGTVEVTDWSFRDVAALVIASGRILLALLGASIVVLCCCRASLQRHFASLDRDHSTHNVFKRVLLFIFACIIAHLLSRPVALL